MKIATSYRNSKNYGDNWISAGYALWFLRESRYLNGARAIRSAKNCAVSGTGFAFTREILDRIGSWHFFLLTEDIEFTNRQRRAGGGEPPPAGGGWGRRAITTDFRQWWQRRPRGGGYLQVFGRYGLDLMKGMFGGFSPATTWR